MPRRRRAPSSRGLAGCQDVVQPTSPGRFMATPTSTTSTWATNKGQDFSWEHAENSLLSELDLSSIHEETGLLNVSLAEEDEFFAETGLQSPSSFLGTFDVVLPGSEGQYSPTVPGWQALDHDQRQPQSEVSGVNRARGGAYLPHHT